MRYPVINASTAGFLFLIVVLGVATASGFRASAGLSVVAMIAYNFFFLPPVGYLTIADPDNWVALSAFLVTALVASHLSDRAQREAAEARRRQRETEQLYSLSRAILLTDAGRPIGPQAAQSIAQIFDSPSVTILDAKSNSLFRGGSVDLADAEERMEDVVRLGVHRRFAEEDLDVWPIALGGSAIGALAAVGLRQSDGAVQSVLNLVAIALERVRTEEAANKAEIARQSEEFKSTLLDAIAHEFKTPLTSIKAAVTGLGVVGKELAADQQELVSIVEEEADRLSQLVTEAVKMAEIDAGKVTLRRAAVNAGSLVRAAVASFAGRGEERIRVAGGEDRLPLVFVDADLVVLALRQLLDNALKYSEAASPVSVAVKSWDGRVVVRIIDVGVGIPERDRERIFEKFYRRPPVRGNQPGTGLGLHIARELARIHGGDLWVEPGPGRTGSAFCLALPCQDETSA